MSNRGGKNRGGRNNWNHGGGGRKFYDGPGNNYSEHDDRVERDRSKVTDVKRRVSFKPFSGGRNKGGVKITDMQIRAHLEDDEAMGGGAGGFAGGDGFDGERRNFKKGFKGRRRGSPIPRGPQFRKKLVPGPSGWFEVKIPYGHKYEKEFILRSLVNAISPLIFIPQYWKVEDTAVSFYIEDFQAAEALQKVDRMIGLPDGRKMIVIVRNGNPQYTVNDQLKERMKLAMVKRYNPATKALNLEKFHTDPDLSDIFCALLRPQIMLAAFDVIKDNIPDLEALNLNDNKLHMMDHFRHLGQKAPNLKILYLANNKIPHITSLDSLKSLSSLVEINLEGNPLKDRLKDPTVYVSEVRKRLPKVIKLDNIDLPPPIGFDVPEDDHKLPSAKASFLVDTAGAGIVRQFLEQYFMIYDSDNRQPLLEAYHEHAMISMTVFNSPSQSSQQRLQSYLNFNRNLNAKRDLDSRCRFLKMGRLPVVSFLSELPNTKHDPQTFVVDLTLFTPQLILLTVTGVFKERKVAVINEPYRSFQRSLVIVPSGGGFCIRNEMIHINNATRIQEEKAFKDPASNGFQATAAAAAAVVPPVAVAPVPPVAAVPPVVGGPDDNTKLQMVQAMAAHSNMNLEWSRKCLEETNWDFERAGFAFTELHKQNRIPPEAFVKN